MELAYDHYCMSTYVPGEFTDYELPAADDEEYQGGEGNHSGAEESQ